MQWQKWGDEMSPRTGRPPKLGKPKSVSLQLRITQETSDKLQECANKLSATRTEVIEKGIDLVFEQVLGKNNNGNSKPDK